MHFASATFADLAALRPRLPGRYWRALQRQRTETCAWTLWHEDARQAVCGVAALDGGVLECWLVLRPDGRPSLSVLRFILLSIASHFPDRIVIARIREANRQGQRLASIAGFVPVDEFMDEARTIRTWVRPRLVAEDSNPETQA